MAKRDRTAPSISITSPVNNSTYTTNTTITINVTGNDNGTGVRTINIYVTPPGGIRTLIGTSSFVPTRNVARTASQTYSVTTLGFYYLEGEVIDGAGNSSFQRYTITRTDSTTTTTTSSSTTVAPTLPSSKILNAPSAWSQGGEGSCASMATGLAATVTYFYHSNSTTYNTATNTFTPEFLYNQTKFAGGCGAGASVVKNLDFLMTDGCCRWDLCPYLAQPQGCQTTAPLGACDACIVTPTATTDAANFKIKIYGAVNPTDLYTLKRLIVNNHAIVFAGNLNSNMNITDPSYIYCTSGTVGGAHAFVIIGYDDAKQAFLIQNSYGPNYANDGRFWWCYNNFVQNASTCYWMTYRTDQNPFPII